MPRLRAALHDGLVTGRHVGQNRLKTVSGRSHAWFRKFGAQTFLVFESREETQIRPIVQGGKKDFFPKQKHDWAAAGLKLQGLIGSQFFWAKIP